MFFCLARSSQFTVHNSQFTIRFLTHLSLLKYPTSKSDQAKLASIQKLAGVETDLLDVLRYRFRYSEIDHQET